MGITLANNAHTTLSADASSIDTVIYVEDIDSFPALDVDDYFYLTLERTSGALEIVKVTQVNASSFNVVRGQEDTIPISFSIGSNAKLNMTVQNITDLIATGSNIHDDAYGSGWNGDTTDAPSRNAVYDKIETLLPTASYTAADVLAKLLTVDGSGSLLDADFLDGNSSAYYLAASSYTAADVLAKLLTVDGAGSGLDADLLDGLSSADFRVITNNVFESELIVGKSSDNSDKVLTIKYGSSAPGLGTIAWERGGTTKWRLRANSSDTWFLYNDTLGSSAISIAAADNAVTFASATSSRYFHKVYETAGGAALSIWANNTAAVDVRWGLGKNSTAESGSNVGSDFDLYTYTDSGILADRVFRVSRATAIVDFTYAPTVADSAYGAGWNGSTAVPTRNAVYDKIESLATLSDGDKGDITVLASGTTWTIDNSVVTLAKMADMATASLIYRKTAGTGAPEINTLATLKTDLGLTGTNSGDQTITLTGNVTGSGTGSFATTIASNVVTLGMMATIATDSILGRATAATGNVEVLTALPWAYTGDVTRAADSNAQTIAAGVVTYAMLASAGIATAAEYRANTASNILDTAGVWAAAVPVALTDAATIAVDFSTGINFTVTLAGNRTLGQPTNAKPGQSGVIEVRQDGTGTRTLAFHADYLWAGGTDGVLSTAVSTMDALFYYVRADSKILLSLSKAFA